MHLCMQIWDFLEIFEIFWDFFEIFKIFIAKVTKIFSTYLPLDVNKIPPIADVYLLRNSVRGLGLKVS